MLNASIYLLLGILVITCLLMVLIVLMQRPKNEGLGASFGGGMTQDLFGAQTTNVLQKFTVYLGAVFFLSSLVLTILYSKASMQTSGVQKTLQAAAAKPKAKPSPTPVTAPVQNDALPAATAAALPAAAATPAPAAVLAVPSEPPAPITSTEIPAPTAQPDAALTPAPEPSAAPTTFPDVVVPAPAASPTP